MKNLLKKVFKRGWLPYIFSCIFFLGAFYLGALSAEISLPSQKHTSKLYTTTHKDLEPALLQALSEAKYSIDISSYSFTSQKIIGLLNKKAEDGLLVNVFYDNKANPKLFGKFSKKVRILPWKGKGLMHRKAIVIDSELVFLGSSNMTWSSLNKNSNLMFGFWDPPLAKSLSLNVLFERSSSLFPDALPISGKDAVIWPLPQARTSAEKRVGHLLDSAKKSIQIAMYTWTKQDFAKKAIDAHHRGVKVEVLLDRDVLESMPAARKVLRLLKEGHVPVSIYRGKGLLHHKFALIDGTTLLTGSLNWTKRGFEENWEYLMEIPLNKQQKKKLRTIWKEIKEKSK